MSICYNKLDESIQEEKELKKRIDRNLRILKAVWVQEVHDGLNYIEEHMGDVLVKGILKKLKKAVDPVSSGLIKKIYNIFLADLREKTIKQIDIFIKCAKLYDGSNLEDLLSKHTKDYLKFDLTYKSCNKKHKNFEKIKNCQIGTFRHRIIKTYEMMLCNGNATSDKEIIKNTYRDYNTSKKELYKQLEYTRRAINLIFDDDDILKVNPVIRRPVLDVLRMGYEYAVKHLIENLKEIYGKKQN
ncbi:MAG: hypothetical protein ACTSO9_05260 [Candidatus Helarchaeota archaeon]